jgi:hypothetical protein
MYLLGYSRNLFGADPHLIMTDSHLTPYNPLLLFEILIEVYF